MLYGGLTGSDKSLASKLLAQIRCLQSAVCNFTRLYSTPHLGGFRPSTATVAGNSVNCLVHHPLDISAISCFPVVFC